MLLTVDIGNTNITFGLFENENFVEEFRLSSDYDLSEEEYEISIKSFLSDYNIDSCICASVVEELTEIVKSALISVLGIDVIFIDSYSNNGVKIVADNPEEAGADRIANAAAVYSKYPGRAVVVVDFGTATTFDIVNSKGEFCGGIIAPGINTQLECLHSSTSKLPKIDVGTSDGVLASNTKDAILAGVVRGTACMVDGLIAQCEDELGEPVVLVATGGYCSLIQKYTKRKFDEVNPILTLQGLRVIYERSRQ